MKYLAILLAFSASDKAKLKKHVIGDDNVIEFKMVYWNVNESSSGGDMAKIVQCKNNVPMPNPITGPKIGKLKCGRRNLEIRLQINTNTRKHHLAGKLMGSKLKIKFVRFIWATLNAA